MYKSNSSFSKGTREIRLQDVFLNYCRRERIVVEIQTLNNTIQRGRIIGFDNHAIILEDKNRQHLIYKNAAVAVNPLSAVNYIFCDHSPKEETLKADAENNLHGYSEYSANFS